MPRGDKSKYTNKQERQADHIAEGYEKRGVSEKEAERRAWPTVNKGDGGGKKAGGSDVGNTRRSGFEAKIVAAPHNSRPLIWPCEQTPASLFERSHSVKTMEGRGTAGRS